MSEPKPAEQDKDLEQVKVEDMELTEQQLRMVSGGKGGGGGQDRVNGLNLNHATIKPVMSQ